MPQKWKITAILFVIGALNYGDRTAIASLFPLLRADLDLSDMVLAGIGSVFLWSYALGSPIAGYLADRLSRSRMLLFSLVAWSVVMALTGFVHSGRMLLVTRALLGIAECACLPASIALIADHHGPETRATAMGFQIAGTNCGLIGGSVLAGYLGEHLGWRVDFFILGGSGLVLALVASLVLRDGPRAKIVDNNPSPWNAIWQLLLMPSYIAVISGAMLISIGTWIFLNWLPLYFHDRFHLSLAVAGLSSSSALQIAAIVGAVLGGNLSDRLANGSSRRRLLLLSIGYFCAAPFLLTFLWGARLSQIDASIFLYSLMITIGSASECPIICEVAGPRLSSTALGILNMMNCLAGGVGILWAGFLKRHYGLGVAFGSLAGTVVCAGGIVLTGYFVMTRQEHRFASSNDPIPELKEGRF